MALPMGLNDLAKVALLASDSSYFKTDLTGSPLAALPDTTYGVAPQYAVPSGYVAVAQEIDPDTGFGYITYQNEQTNEVIVAMRGTDGPNPQDWVANSQYLGWNQWNADGGGRDLVFGFLNGLTNPDGGAFTGKIHFTGQSLGGGLAQYAAYEYVRDQKALAAQNGTTFDASRITLTTFNGFGGVLGLQQNVQGGYQSSVLADIGSNAHFYTEGDLVSRLGSLNGVGHTGGTTYMLNAHASQIDPDTGQPFLLNAIDAHRIETGFYPFLQPGVEFQAAVARPIEYLPMQNVQQIAALFGRVLNDQDVSPLESAPRLVAGLIAGLSLGDPAETNALVQAVLTNLHSANQMPDAWYVMLRKLDWGAIAQTTALVAPGATGAAYGLSLLAATLSDALEFQADRHLQLFNTLREWVSSAVSTVEQGISSSDRRVQAELLLALVPGAAIGSKLVPLLQPLALDVNAFAQTLVTAGTNWLHEGLVAIRDQGNSLGQNLAQLSADLAAVVPDIALGVGMSQATVQNYLTTVIVPFLRDTANGYANAATEFLQEVAGAFDLGRTLNFNEVNLVAQAYAAELDDRRLAAPIRSALEEAQAIVQQAGQTVVVQQGIGVNPFNGTGFNPDTTPPASLNLNEGQLRTLTINLPYEAGTGGQRLQLSLAGPGASTFTVLTGSGTLTPQNGSVLLTIPEGQRQLTVGLRSTQDISVNSALTVSATLLDATGQASHTTHVEANVTLADTGDLPSSDLPTQGPVERIWTGTPGWDELDTGGFPENHLISAGDGNDFVDGWAGDDRLYGEGGADQEEETGTFYISKRLEAVCMR